MATHLAKRGATRALGLCMTILIAAAALAPGAAALAPDPTHLVWPVPAPVDGKFVPRTVAGGWEILVTLGHSIGIPIAQVPCPGMGSPPCACGPYPPFTPQGDGMWIC